MADASVLPDVQLHLAKDERLQSLACDGAYDKPTAPETVLRREAPPAIFHQKILSL